MDREIILGNAPFCGDSSARCGVTPGYRAVDKFKGSGFSKCWTGHKTRCRFDLDTFKDTAIYRRLKEQNETLGLNNNFFPQYKWFGTAPFCAPNKGDLAKEGYVYVKSDRCGDGRCCATGEKMLGMKPETAEQREELEREIKNYEEQQRVKDAFIDKAITGMKIIGDFGSKYGGYIPGVGTYVKAVGDGVSTLAGLMQKDKPKDDSNKVSGYNDSFINPNSLNKELKDLAEGGKLSKFAFSDPEYVKDIVSSKMPTSVF